MKGVMDSSEQAGHLERIERDGYSIIERVFDDAWADAVVGALDELETSLEITPSENDFEGAHTWRVYNLLARGKIFQEIPVHDRLLPVIDAVLDPGCLISSLSSVGIGPGETAQMIHADDMLMPLAKPHVATVCNSMWALSDFTEANGATRIVPGSHRYDHSPDVTKHHESIPAEMPRGSVLVWHGSLWHGGGANRSEERRVGIAMNYCAGWVRQQENQQLGIPLEIARGFSPRLRELVGYGVYHQLIGHIDKRSPVELLGESGELRTVWDR
jgi:ectoine hydroxylase-related dioxygenase (phytanoyl-CoA dioxygenase family)